MLIQKLLPFLFYGVYIHLCILGGFYLYNELPRIINLIAGYIVLPIGLFLLFSFLLERITIALKQKYNDKESIQMLFLIPILLFWLPMGVGNIFGVNYYLKMEMAKPVDIKLSEIHNFKDSSFVQIVDIQKKVEWLGESVTTSTGSRVSYNKKSSTHYYAVPLLSKNITDNTSYPVWLVKGTNPSSFESSEEANATLKNLLAEKSDFVRGVIVRDPYDLNNFKEAVRISANRNHLTVPDDLILIESVDKDYLTLRDELRRNTIIFYMIVLSLFLCLPAYLFFK
ncbi:MAG: hypothetical protein KA146_04295 [Leptospiraceae bacterium]|nr:hypothetical protein [Leptospiraceae bacterium]